MNRTRSPRPRSRSLLLIAKTGHANPLQFVPGVGPLRLELFQKLGVRRPLDSSFFFSHVPGHRSVSGIAELVPGIRATVVGQIVDLDQRFSFDGRPHSECSWRSKVADTFDAFGIHQMFRREQFPSRHDPRRNGNPKVRPGSPSIMRHPEFVILNDSQRTAGPSSDRNLSPDRGAVPETYLIGHRSCVGGSSYRLSKKPYPTGFAASGRIALRKKTNTIRAAASTTSRITDALRPCISPKPLRRRASSDAIHLPRAFGLPKAIAMRQVPA